MQCSVTLERDLNGGNMVKMVNNIKNTCRKDYNLDNIVDQQCTRFQDIADQSIRVGMPTCSVDQSEAVRRYYAAFPALKKGQESPLQYYLPPPSWCRKTDQKVNMQSELSIITKDWNSKNKKLSTGKERRNSYHGQRKNNKKRCNSYSRSFESKESLPEWVTHEGVWDMETQDPVKEFIRAIALDEGYGTCENTVTDELKEIAQVKFRLNENMVPAWDDGLDLDAAWVIADDLDPPVRSPVEEELYAKFEAKFDRSIEALWKDQNNTPDDEYQDLPIDFQDLLASPSDNLFGDPEKSGLVSLTESIWSTASDGFPARESPSRLADALHARLQPLRLAEREPRPLDPFALYESEDIYDAAEDVACTMRSLTAINHSRDRSGFAEVPPRRPAAPRPSPPSPPPPPTPPRAAPLSPARTHFRPIRREADAETRYVDGDCFDIRGDLDPVEFHRSASGGVYIEGSEERYLEYRGEKGIDYGRLRLTDAQRCPDLDDPGFKLRFPLRQRDAGVQTDAQAAWCMDCGGGEAAKRPRAMESIWSAVGAACSCAPPPPSGPPPPDELTREWEELLSDISAAHAEYAPEPEPAPDRKRRHSAALRCGAPCSHPHARFLKCCSLLDRPLTR